MRNFFDCRFFYRRSVSDLDSISQPFVYEDTDTGITYDTAGDLATKSYGNLGVGCVSLCACVRVFVCVC